MASDHVHTTANVNLKPSCAESSAALESDAARRLWDVRLRFIEVQERPPDGQAIWQPGLQAQRQVLAAARGGAGRTASRRQCALDVVVAGRPAAAAAATAAADVVEESDIAGCRHGQHGHSGLEPGPPTRGDRRQGLQQLLLVACQGDDVPRPGIDVHLRELLCADAQHENLGAIRPSGLHVDATLGSAVGDRGGQERLVERKVVAVEHEDYDVHAAQRRRGRG
mmetsp:Transcript_87167/g.249730  ORF Transcript_87167/g.249730 Transcript_87167/m.249730 type:complete len:224 (-) Transcript_87167:750-1421(-)